MGKKYVFFTHFSSPFNHFFPIMLFDHIFATPPGRVREESHKKFFFMNQPLKLRKHFFHGKMQKKCHEPQTLGKENFFVYLSLNRILKYCRKLRVFYLLFELNTGY